MTAATSGRRKVEGKVSELRIVSILILRYFVALNDSLFIIEAKTLNKAKGNRAKLFMHKNTPRQLEYASIEVVAQNVRKLDPGGESPK